jgi:superfamily II DNA or RNA helicase
VRLTVDQTYVAVKDATKHEHEWLDSYLTFSTEQFVRRGGRTKHVTEDLHLFNVRRDRFPTGLLPLVRKNAPANGVHLDINDRRLAPLAYRPDADLAWLRDYQREAVKRAAIAGRGILWLATGAGKTEIAAGLTRAVPGRWLFVVHRTNLARAAAERIERRTGERVGMIDADNFDVERVTCATFQTLTRMLAGQHKRVSREDAVRLMARWDGVMVDEAHTLPAQTYYRTLMSIPNAHWRIGLSGTPLARSDRKSIFTIASLGPVLMRVKAETLIEAGHLSRPIIRMMTVPQSVSKPTYQGVYSAAVVKSTPRNRAVIDLALRAHKPSMVFVKQLKHGQRLKQLLEKANLRVSFVNGSAPVDARMAAVERLERGDLDVIVTTAVFQEGVDAPGLRSVVLADAGRSVIALLQKIGRGMRRTDVKTTFEVWDVFDLRGAEGGKKWLENQARARARNYLEEGHTVEVSDSADGPWRPMPKNLRVR